MGMKNGVAPITWRPPKLSHGASIALVALAGVGAAAGLAYATIPTNNVINSCYTKSGGTLRVIDGTTSSCSPKETSLNWNVQGPKGDIGLQGPKGDAGPQGVPGAPRTQG